MAKGILEKSDMSQSKCLKKLPIRKKAQQGLKPLTSTELPQIQVQITAGPKGSPATGECQGGRKSTRPSSVDCSPKWNLMTFSETSQVGRPQMFGRGVAVGHQF